MLSIVIDQYKGGSFELRIDHPEEGVRVRAIGKDTDVADKAAQYLDEWARGFDERAIHAQS